MTTVIGAIGVTAVKRALRDAATQVLLTSASGTAAPPLPAGHTGVVASRVTLSPGWRPSVSIDASRQGAVMPTEAKPGGAGMKGPQGISALKAPASWVRPS